MGCWSSGSNLTFLKFSFDKALMFKLVYSSSKENINRTIVLNLIVTFTDFAVLPTQDLDWEKR